jgi:hypothetical protein
LWKITTALSTVYRYVDTASFCLIRAYLVVRDHDLEERLDELAEEHVETSHRVLDELAQVLDQPVVVLRQRRLRSA